jgi:predicted dehydrogenase
MEITVMIKDRKVRVGIVGAGGIANFVHLPSLVEIEDADLVAVCDLRYERAVAAAKEYGIKTAYWDMYEMLDKENLDCAFILVEPDRLFRAAQDCMLKGVSVIMEKPAGTSAHQANALVRIAKEQGVVCAVAMNRRHIPLVQEVKRIMNELTTITQVDGQFMKYTDLSSQWLYSSAYDTDGIHALDLVRYLAGSEVKKCATVTGRFSDCPVDNAWSSVMQFENGVTGTMRSSYQAGARIHMFEMHGPEASAFINLGRGGNECEATIICRKSGSMYSLASGGVGGADRIELDGKQLAGDDRFHAFYGYKQEDIDFIQAIKNGTSPMCTIEDMAKSMELVEMVHRTSL